MQSDEFDGEDINSQSDLLNEVNFLSFLFIVCCLLIYIIFIIVQGSNSENVDLSDNSLQVVISDALSEKDRVKFTVLSKV